MPLKLPVPIRRLLKATGFWREHSLILREFKYFKWVAIWAVVFSLFAAVFEGLGIGLIASFLQALTDPEQPPLQTGFRWFDIWVLGINDSESSRFLRSAALILITIWLRSGFTYLGQLYTKFSEFHLADRLRKRLFEQFQSLSLGYFSQKRSGELINTTITEVYQVRLAFNVAATFIARGFTLLVYAISMFMLSWQLTLGSVMMFSLLAVGLTTLMRRVREASFETSKAGGQFTSVVMEFISGIRTVHAFATQEFERKRFYKAADAVMESYFKAASASALVQPLTEGVSTTILIVMIIVATTVFVASGALQVSSLLTFLFVLFRLVPIVAQVNGAWAQLSNFQGSLSNVKELLRTDDKKYLEDGKTRFQGLKRAIEFVSVDFGYDSDNLVLHDITLTLNRGQMTALVGGSGAGKTTLADLIPRFYEPTQGRILIDGVELPKLEINSFRHHLAVVSQDTFIFNTSVRNNIAYGSQSASDEAIRKAAQLANALDFILEMPEGFDTQLGDRGVRLSGGQRQRIAIARALLRDPEILILDEATSALDSVSERLIQESLEKLSVGRTVIAIAHRLSTIVRADKVVVLEQGRIVEQGGYQELLERRGKLWEYHRMQHELSQAG